MISESAAPEIYNTDSPRLAAVNFFLGCVGIVQVGRIYNYHRSLDESPVEAIKAMEHEVVDSAKEAAVKAEAAVEKKSA